jgi:hypothetical protein
MVRSIRMRDERHVALTERKRNTYRILMRKLEGMMPLRRPRLRGRVILKRI